MKAIAVLRVSTESQQIDDQRDELYAFIKSQGYDEIIPIEAVGASAVKLNDRYMYMVQRIKDTINTDKDVKAVFVWHLNRLGRNDVILMEFKEFFIKNHIQFICKNPYLKLLNDDGTVNGGMELAFSLFSTMSKQEVEERKAKFKRAKSSMAAKGQYLGGNTLPFGYMVVDKTTFVENQEESEIVRSVFDMYSTGKYSSYTLSEELGIDHRKIMRIVSNIAYTGESVGNLGIHYPAIISKELFDKCQEIRYNNKISTKKGGRVILGRGIVRCPVCGAVCTSNSKHYSCCRHFHNGCSNGFNLRQEVADELLYRFAFGLHMMWLMNISEGKMDELRRELKLVEEKIEHTQKKIDNFKRKKERVIETYLEGYIDKKTRDSRLSKMEDEAKFQNEFKLQLQDKRRAILRLLEDDGEDTVENFMRAAESLNSEDKSNIIHRHIESLVAVPVSFGKRDPRTKRDNAVHIVITSMYGTTAEYLYIPKFYEGKNLYVLADGEWVPDSLDSAVYAMQID